MVPREMFERKICGSSNGIVNSTPAITTDLPFRRG
jgi:hypothetical protein